MAKKGCFHTSYLLPNQFSLKTNFIAAINNLYIYAQKTKKQLPKKGGLGQFAELRGAWSKRGGGVFEVDTPMNTK